ARDRRRTSRSRQGSGAPYVRSDVAGSSVRASRLIRVALVGKARLPPRRRHGAPGQLASNDGFPRCSRAVAGLALLVTPRRSVTIEIRKVFPQYRKDRLGTVTEDSGSANKGTGAQSL